MIPPVDVSEFELLVTYSSGSEEEIHHSILGAFDALDADVTEGEPLYDHVDPDTLNALFRSGTGPMRLSLRLWGYPVLVTREDVRIYVPRSGPGANDTGD